MAFSYGGVGRKESKLWKGGHVGEDIVIVHFRISKRISQGVEVKIFQGNLCNYERGGRVLTVWSALTVCELFSTRSICKYLKRIYVHICVCVISILE